MFRSLAKFKIFSFHDLVLLIGFFSLYFYQLPSFLDDPGLGWHLANGLRFLEVGSVPEYDWLLATDSARPWIADQWLADFFMAVLFQVGSWPLLSFVFSFVFFVTFLITLYYGLRQNSSSALAASILSLIIFKAAQVQFVLRPLLFGFLFFVLLLRLLNSFSEALDRSEASTFNLGLILTPIFLLWVNIHPSFVLGLLVLGLFFVGNWIDGRFVSEVEDTSYTSSFLILIVFTTALGLCSPYGVDLYRSILWLGASSVRHIYAEWQPLNLKAPEGVFFIAVCASLITSWFCCYRDNSNRKTWELLGFLVFAYLSLTAVRMLPYFMIIMARPTLDAWNLMAAGVSKLSLRQAFLIRQAWFKWESYEQMAKSGVIAMFIVGLFLLYQNSFVSGLQNIYAVGKPNADQFPYKSLQYLKDNELESSKNLTIVNHMDFGGFISLYGDGVIKAVIDDRSSLLGEGFYQQYFNNLKIDGSWKAWSSDLGAKFLLLKPNDYLSKHLKRCYSEAVVVEEVSAVLFNIDLVTGGGCGE